MRASAAQPDRVHNASRKALASPEARSPPPTRAGGPLGDVMSDARWSQLDGKRRVGEKNTTVAQARAAAPSESSVSLSTRRARYCSKTPGVQKAA